MSDLPDLLTEDVMWIEPIRQFFRVDFVVLGQDRRILGRLLSSGGALGRAMFGNREFVLVDANDQVLAHIADPVNLWRDSFEVISPDGAVLARVRNESVLFGPRLSISLSDEPPLEISGSLWDREYEISSSSGSSLAHATRARQGCLQLLSSNDTYQLTFRPQVPPQHRLAILGAVLAVDLIRMKARAAANSNNASS